VSAGEWRSPFKDIEDSVPRAPCAGPTYHSVILRAFNQDAMLIKTETGRGHTPLFHDVEVTSHSFKVADGTVYVADTHNRALDVTMNGHTRLRFEKDGHVGDYIHILDDSGKDRKLHIVGKTAPTR
jgi:hypothetical protein